MDMKTYEIVKNYRNNPTLRKSFNGLAKVTFDLDFEDWYQNGYWGDLYNPYSVVIGDEVVANVSVNLMDFTVLQGGQDGISSVSESGIKHYIQLGTVMTKKTYRNKGLIREIMREIEKDYGKETDGIFLFANDSVLDFYPKFGFRKAAEYQYEKEVTINGVRTIKQIRMKERQDFRVLEKAIEKSVPYSRFDTVHKKELALFYATKFMQENVFYDKEEEAYVIAETEGDCLFLHAIFSENPVQLDQIIEDFGREIRRVKLGFTPKETQGFRVSELREEDTTLFLKGNGFPDLETAKLMFSTLTHA